MPVVTFRMPVELVAAVDVAAARALMSRSVWVREALEAALSGRGLDRDTESVSSGSGLISGLVAGSSGAVPAVPPRAPEPSAVRGVLYRCPVHGCDFEARSPAARCPAHGRTVKPA